MHSPESRVSIALLGFVSLLACGPYQIVSPYDETIDTTVHDFDVEFRLFVAKLTRGAGTTPGTYDANLGFYDEWTARLDALHDRAVARADEPTCPTIAALKKIPLPDALKPLVTSAGPASPPSEGCTAALLRIASEQLGLFAQLHKSLGEKGLSDKAIKAPSELMKVTIRAIQAVEIANKSGK